MDIALEKYYGLREFKTSLPSIYPETSIFSLVCIFMYGKYCV